MCPPAVVPVARERNAQGSSSGKACEPMERSPISRCTPVAAWPEYRIRPGPSTRFGPVPVLYGRRIFNTRPAARPSPCSISVSETHCIGVILLRSFRPSFRHPQCLMLITSCFLVTRPFNPVAAGSSPAPSTSFSFVCNGEGAAGRGHRILCGLPGPRPVRSARIADGLPGLVLHHLFHPAQRMCTFGITKSDDPADVQLRE